MILPNLYLTEIISAILKILVRSWLAAPARLLHMRGRLLQILETGLTALHGVKILKQREVKRRLIQEQDIRRTLTVHRELLQLLRELLFRYSPCGKLQGNPGTAP